MLTRNYRKCQLSHIVSLIVFTVSSQHRIHYVEFLYHMTYRAGAVRLAHPPGNSTVTSGNSTVMHVTFPKGHQNELNDTVCWKCGLMLISFSQQPTGAFQQDFASTRLGKFQWLCSLWGQICSKASLQLNLQFTRHSWKLYFFWTMSLLEFSVNLGSFTREFLTFRELWFLS